MDRCSVFVDAGYLFAQGSALVAGSRRRREDLRLDIAGVRSALQDAAAMLAPGVAVLRIYWYDGAPMGRLSAQQYALAETDGIKLRLGALNLGGEQKGVDPLIVSDLVELSRNRSICDAVLVTGDDDVRLGVLVAQSYGVRVHLVGIEPARATQSRLLRMEADTLTEWNVAHVGAFLSVREEPVQPPVTPAGEGGGTPGSPLCSVVRAFVDALSPDQVQGARSFTEGAGGLPPDIDRRLLPACRTAIGRNLDASERRLVRAIARDMLLGLPTQCAAQ
jgi:uncharacterized LabA/DUF88 family protein